MTVSYSNLLHKKSRDSALGLDIYRVTAWYALLSCSGKERAIAYAQR